MPSRVAGLALAAASSLLSVGCRVGSLQALDGEWPIGPAAQAAPTPWTECGGGPGRALVRAGHGTYRLITPTDSRRLRCRANLTDARVVGDVLYRLRGRAVTSQALDDLDDAGAARTLTHVEGARDLDATPGADAADPGDDLLVVVGDGAVYSLTPRAAARALWEGDALAVAIDARRRAVWIAARAPLAVIDLVDLASGEVRLRVPLPIELESASLTLVVGPQAVVAYAHDRPISSALLVAPERGLALPLRARPPEADAPTGLAAAGEAGLPARLRPGLHEPEASPPLCSPPGVLVDGHRLSLGGDPGATFGRVAPLPDGRFLVVEVGSDGVRLASLHVAAGDDRAVLRLDPLTPPGAWSGRVEAAAWDAEGAVLISSQDLLRVTRAGLVLEPGRRTLRGGLRRATNYALASTIALVEATTALTINTLICAPLLPLSPLPLFMGEPAASLFMLSAPLWLPTAIAFDFF